MPMKMFIQACLNGRVPVPAEKRFPYNSIKGKVDGVGYEQGRESAEPRAESVEQRAGSTKITSGKQGTTEFAALRSQLYAPSSPEDIYQRYLAAYKTGVFNLIKEEKDLATGEALPRKYFSGGISPGKTGHRADHSPAMAPGDKALYEGAMASLAVRLSITDKLKALPSRIGKTVQEAYPRMISWLKSKFRFVAITYLLTGSLMASAAQYRYWLDTYGQPSVTVTAEKNDNLDTVLQGLARFAGKTLTDEEKDFFVRKFAEENKMTVSTNTFPAGTTFSGWDTRMWMYFLEMAGTSQIIASNKIVIPGYPSADMDFLMNRDKKSLFSHYGGYAFSGQRRILINVDALVYLMRDQGQWAFENRLNRLLYHEYLHIVTMPIIRSKDFEGHLAKWSNNRKGNEGYQIAEEAVGILGEVYSFKEPRMIFREKYLNETWTGTPNQKIMVASRDVFSSLLVAKYGSVDDALNLSDKEFRNGLEEIFQESFGMRLPDRGYFVIPEKVLEAARQAVRGEFQASTTNTFVEGFLATDLKSEAETRILSAFLRDVPLHTKMTVQQIVDGLAQKKDLETPPLSLARVQVAMPLVKGWEAVPGEQVPTWQKTSEPTM